MKTRLCILCGTRIIDLVWDDEYPENLTQWPTMVADEYFTHHMGESLEVGESWEQIFSFETTLSNKLKESAYKECTSHSTENNGDSDVGVRKKSGRKTKWTYSLTPESRWNSVGQEDRSSYS